MRRSLGTYARLTYALCLIGLLGWAGVPLAAEESSDREQGYFGLTPEISSGGIHVSSVTPEGPADVAGLRLGDTLLLLDGKPIPSGSQRALIESFTRFEAGETVEVTFRRGEDIRTARVTLVPVPQPARELQERLAEIERRAEEFERFDRFLTGTDRVDVTLSEADTPRFRATGEEEWQELPAAVAETLEPLIRRLLKEAEEPIVTLRVERTDTGALSLVPDSN